MESSELKVNTLVRHKRLRNAGIGCVSKVFKSMVNVNFGVDDVMKCRPSMLELVDVRGCATIPFHEFRAGSMINNVKHDTVIVGNEVQHYVGIGWITQGVVTEEDLKKYPRVVD